jgi:hypothetical protein
MSLPSRFHRGPQRFDGLGKFIKSEADGPAMMQTIAGCHEGVGGGSGESRTVGFWIEIQGGSLALEAGDWRFVLVEA